MARRGFRYSRWDGTQTGFDLDAESLLREMGDDLTYHGDLHAALRRLLQDGMADRNGEHLMGLREMLERLRQRRREELERRDLGGIGEDIAQQLRDIVDAERRGIERRLDDARASGDEPRAASMEELAATRNLELDMLPPDLAGTVRELSDYEFVDDGAREDFERLVEQLRAQLVQSHFNRLASGMQNLDAAQMQRIKDMLAELNQMLEQRTEGIEPDFDGFMQRHGDLVPGNPRTLDELLELIARSMSQMQRLMNSMTPEQRAELQALSDELLGDLDMRWQLDSLGRNLQRAFPQMPWGERLPFDGDDPVDLGQLAGMLEELGDLDDLEHLLDGVTQPNQLAEVDIDRARDLLGEDAARSLERLRELARLLEEAGLIEQREGRLELTPRAVRAIAREALGDLYRRLLADRAGRHDSPRTGVGHERSYDHKPYEFGDPFNLDVEQTVRNAIRRAGAGTPVRLDPSDFEIDETELDTRCATVLLLDVSLSMPMRDNFLPAKKVAMALHALITTQYPRDHFSLVSFGRVAREVRPERLPEMSWDFEWGTNMHHALALGRSLLANERGTRQIIMVTDGEPTAHVEDGETYFQYPPSPVTIEETLKEVVRCTRAGIRINTFMLDETFALRAFVERMTKLNRGRAFFATGDTLGEYVLVDFLEQRRAHRRAG